MEDLRLAQALRDGDESAFVALLDRYHVQMVRLATAYVGDRTLAEDVAQEAWLGVVQGIGRFEGRSSLKTWIFRILTNRAKTRAEREGRTVPFSALNMTDDDSGVDPDRFNGPDSALPGHWNSYPAAWDTIPDEQLLAAETRAVIADAIAALPPAQREVIQLRDVDGWTAQEVCNVLQLTETNQRVLLHRARLKVRNAIEQYMNGARQ